MLGTNALSILRLSPLEQCYLITYRPSIQIVQKNSGKTPVLRVGATRRICRFVDRTAHAELPLLVSLQYPKLPLRRLHPLVARNSVLNGRKPVCFAPINRNVVPLWCYMRISIPQKRRNCSTQAARSDSVLPAIRSTRKPNRSNPALF